METGIDTAIAGELERINSMLNRISADECPPRKAVSEAEIARTNLLLAKSRYFRELANIADALRIEGVDHL